MRPTTTFMAVAWLAFHAGSGAAGPVRLPDGRTLENIDFERHVHALLDRQGCNAGKCHGNRDGKGGFSLSLFAASPESDFLEIARRSNGRHVNVADPDRSLLLLKATGKMQHDGGIRVVPGSWEYRLLREWIAQGARRDAGHGKIKSLKVIPHDQILQINDQVHLHVIAEFADGAKEDVTPFCDFRMPPKEDKDAVEPVRLDPTGVVVAVKPGDVSISVVYRGQVRAMRARVAVPVAKDFVYPKIPEVNGIDREVFGQLRRLNIVPSDLSSDEHFLRRVYIDVIGTLPALAEVRAFLASKDPDKRTKKIDELLAHPRHTALQATRFCETLDLIGGFNDSVKSPRAMAAQMAHDWFRKRLRENMPYDRIVLGVLTATSKDGNDQEAWKKDKQALESAETGFGTAYAKRATLDHFWRLDGLIKEPDPVLGAPHPRKTAEPIESLAERTAAAFLGVQLDCARCHLHPLDGWTPVDHQAFANVFAQVRLESVPVNKKLPTREQKAQRVRLAIAREVLLDAPADLRTHPDTGAVLKPRLLGGPEIDYSGDARQALVRWLARPDNPFFARHFVNGMWQHYFGVSLVESTDSYTTAHASQNSGLLDLLAKDFIAHKFDIRRLQRTILLSRTYQLSATTNDSNKHDRTNFSHVVPRRLGPRVSAELLHAVQETREDFGPGVPAGLSPIEVMHPGPVVRELGVSDSYKDRIDRMLIQFGRKELISRCDPEPHPTSYLFLYGSAETRALFGRSKRIQRLGKSDQPLDEIIDECFQATLSRSPSAEERERCVEHLHRHSKMRVHGIENIIWALVNSKEFAMQH